MNKYTETAIPLIYMQLMFWSVGELDIVAAIGVGFVIMVIADKIGVLDWIGPARSV